MAELVTSSAWLDTWEGVRSHEPLGKHTQYGIGGPARWYLPVSSVAVLADVVRRCHADAIPVFVIGAGSNTLIRDGGISGLVMELTERRMRVLDDATIELSGGMMLPRAALDCAKQGIAGMEFGIGVPGTCGASVRGNAGAFGTEIKDVLVDTDTVGPDGTLRTWSNAECGFTYRHSRLKADLLGHIVVAARFTVGLDEPGAVRERTDAVQSQRKAAQPYGIRSLGSVFKNPPGDHAGRLVEACGLKGVRIGGAGISDKHANFIVNADNASASDVLALIDAAHEAVLTTFGVDLEREIVVAGDDIADGRDN